MQLFAYLAAWLALLALAGIGLFLCLCLAAFASRRSLAKHVAGGIVGSLPSVLLFQVLAAPVVAVAVLAFFGMQSLVGPLSGAPQIVFSVLALLLTFGVFAAASFVGLLVGWGVGYRMASGVPLSIALRASRVVAATLRLASRLRVQSAA